MRSSSSARIVSSVRNRNTSVLGDERGCRSRCGVASWPTSAIREFDDPRLFDISSKQLTQFLRRHRNAEIVPLADVTAGLAQVLELRGGLDAFTDDLETKRAAEGDDCLRDRAATAAGAEARH